MQNTKNKIIAILSAAVMTVSLGVCGHAVYADDIEEPVYPLEGVEDEEDAPGSHYICTMVTTEGEMKPGNTVVAKVVIYGLSAYDALSSYALKLTYNKDVFESAKVSPGEIFIDNTDSFYSHVNRKKGIISLGKKSGDGMYMSSQGVVAYISLKVRDDYNGTDSGKLSLYEKRGMEIERKDGENPFANIDFRDETIKE